MVFLSFLAGDFFGSEFFLYDDLAYHNTAENIANLNRAGGDGYFSGYDKGVPNPYFYNLSAFLYQAIAPDSGILRAFNVIISSLTVPVVYLTAKNLLNQKSALYGSIFLCIYPASVLFSGVMIKDNIVTLLFFSALASIGIKKRANPIPSMLLFLAMCTLLMGFRRDLALPLFMIGGLVGIFYGSRTGVWGKLRSVLIALVAVPALILIWNTDFIVTLVERFIWSVGFMVGVQNDLALTSSGGASTYLRPMSFLEIYKIPFAMLFTVVAPLPGSISFISRIDVLPYVLSWLNFIPILTLPFIGYGFLGCLRLFGQRQRLIFCWLPVVLLLAMSLFNLGTTRYVVSIAPFLCLWAGFGFTMRSAFNVLPLYFLLVLLVFILYLRLTGSGV